MKLDINTVKEQLFRTKMKDPYLDTRSCYKKREKKLLTNILQYFTTDVKLLKYVHQI